MSRRLLIASALLSHLAFAQGTEGPAAGPAAAEAADSDAPEAKEAKALLQKYLAAVKAKKWADAKKLLHPKTLEAIAERKKRMGKEDHPMAPWFHEKVDYWLKDFKVGVRLHDRGPGHGDGGDHRGQLPGRRQGHRRGREGRLPAGQEGREVVRGGQEAGRGLHQGLGEARVQGLVRQDRRRPRLRRSRVR